MGNCMMFAPADIREKAKRSREVDAFLSKHGKQARDEIKLLLLGWCIFSVFFYFFLNVFFVVLFKKVLVNLVKVLFLNK